MDVRALAEEKLLLVVVRNLFVRQNPVLGFKPRTPFREWVANLILEFVEYPVSCYLPYLIRTVALNLGNCKSGYLLPDYFIYEKKAKEILTKHFQSARGTGRQHARDLGGWVWSFFRLFPLELMLDGKLLDQQFLCAARDCISLLASLKEPFLTGPDSIYPIQVLIARLLKAFLTHAPIAKQHACSSEQD